MTVSSGTYVRSIVHDIAIAVGSAAHVVELVRTRQGQFALDPLAASTVNGKDSTEPLHSVVPWSLLEKAIGELKQTDKKDEKKEDADMEKDEDTMLLWEDAVVKALVS